MIYILDTDILSLAEIHASPDYLQLHARVLQLKRSDKIVTTIITYEEQTRGWLSYAGKSRDIAHQVKAYGRLKAHLQTYRRLEVLDFDDAAGAEFGRISALRLRVGTADLKIAAIAMVDNAMLLSKNLRDFNKIPGLIVEDWTKP